MILDADLAKLYGVTTKQLNEQIKRNRERFPEDFMFQLTPEERSEVVANYDHLSKLKFSPVLPYAFTEHGAIVEWVAVPGVEDYSRLYIRAEIKLVPLGIQPGVGFTVKEKQKAYEKKRKR